MGSIFPNGKMNNQIDHVIIEKRHGISINFVRSYRGADGDSDHYLLETSFSFKLSVENK